MSGPTPREFPLLFTRAQARGTRRSWPACPCCHLLIEPRNRARHAKACARRRRENPAMWEHWRADMTGTSTKIIELASAGFAPRAIMRRTALREDSVLRILETVNEKEG
jgi:hypothetical protein